ncbi:hypothetical protein ABBQ32_004226 [Trebouxia sp. C0010 RCD-2024]
MLSSQWCSRLGSSNPLRCINIKSATLRRSATTRNIMHAAVSGTFFLDEFAIKQFNDTKPDYSGTRVYFDTAKFVSKIQQHHDTGKALTEGYAPFCKHIFVPNFTGAKLGSLSITQQNRHMLQTGYSRRRPEELPVLSRMLNLSQQQSF